MERVPSPFRYPNGLPQAMIRGRMKVFLTVLTIAALAAGAYADDTSGGPALVPNNHGGYNVVQPGARPISIPFFGPQGYSAQVIAQSHEKPKFILVPVVQDDGHGNKHTVYKKVRFATAEEAEAARLAQ